MLTVTTVSVIIPYFMQQRYIRETVLSAVQQQGAQTEVIVIDDGSPESAAPCLEGIDGIMLIRTENHGCAQARNFGLQQSRGEFIIFLDGDDLLQPGAIASHLEIFQKNPEAGLSFGGFREIDGSGHVVNEVPLCKRRKNFRRMMLETNPIPSPGVTMIRREALREVGDLRGDFEAQVDDYDLYLRLIQRYPFARNPFYVLHYRKHDTNISRDSSRMLRGTLQVLDRLGASGTLSAAEQRRLHYARGRWIHRYRPNITLISRLQGLYYRFRTVVTVPLTDWFG